MTAECYAEIFRDDLTGEWGWQCFTCGAEDFAFDSLSTAEASATGHDEAGAP